jgi:hypothetical protein
MFLLAAEALAGMTTKEEIRSGRLFPPFSQILDVSAAVMGHLIASLHPWMGQSDTQWRQRVRAQMWSLDAPRSKL